MRLPLSYPGHDRESAQLHHFDGPGRLTLPMSLPVVTPYFNAWGRDVYTRRQAFDDDLQTMPASSTSGSAVIVGDVGFVGLSDGGAGVRVRHDGRGLLSVDIPDGQHAWFNQKLPGLQGWQQFNAQHELTSPQPSKTPRHWWLTEYNTWVEQIRTGGAPGRPAADALSADLIEHWLDRIDALNLPRGKAVLDFGWNRGRSQTMGDWEPRSGLDLPGVLQRVRQRGHVPGLWLAPQQIGCQSAFASSHPDLLIPWQPPDNNAHWGQAFPKPCEQTDVFFANILRRCAAWGVGKIKLDLWYGPRPLMIELLSRFSRIAAEIDPQLEVEGHVADPMVDPTCAVLRTNDVLVGVDRMNWREVTRAHFAICGWSSPHRILNGDFIGGNHPGVSELDFVEHTKMYESLVGRGYACVGLLPDSFSTDTRDLLRSLLERMHAAAGEVSADAMR